MATKSINPSGKPKVGIPDADVARVGRKMKAVALEAGVVLDGLRKLIGVANGFDPAEEPAAARHRVQSVAGRTRTLLKGMRALKENLDDLGDTVR